MKFSPDLRGIEKLVLHEDVVEGQRVGARRILDAAERIAPRDTGAYIRGLKIVEDLDTDRRVCASATAPHSHLVEWGTGPREKKDGTPTGAMPKMRVLARALDAAVTR